MIDFEYKGPELLEFTMNDPLPSGLTCSINNRFIVKIYNSQINIDKTYTVRGIVLEHINPNESHKPKTMNLDVIKKELANLGFSKAHADLALDAIKCIPTAPLNYATLNNLTLELIGLRSYKSSVSTAMKGLEAVAGEKPKAPVKKSAPKKVVEKVVEPAPLPPTPAPEPTLTVSKKKAKPASPDNGPDDDLAKAQNVIASMGGDQGLPAELDM